jgi:hypothetical protein
MLVDLLVVGVAGLRIGAALIRHDIVDLVMWVILGLYAMSKYAETKLKGTKYDY